MFSVAFICTANRCRSIMAHAILVAEARTRSLAIDVYSAGIIDFSDQPPLIETSQACRHFGTQVPEKEPTWVANLPLASIDEFLVMENNHAAALQHQFGISPQQISLLGTFDPKQRGVEITDPFFSYSDEVYRSSYLLIRECIIGYLDTREELRGATAGVI